MYWRARNRARCVDCGCNTVKRREYYFVHNHVWRKARMQKYTGMLCVRCLEARLGRSLTSSDFPRTLLNAKNMIYGSKILKKRIKDGITEQGLNEMKNIIRKLNIRIETLKT